MPRPLLTAVVLLLGLSSGILAGRLSQRYLPSPQASQLHYHGVSGQGHAARPGLGGAGGAGGFGRQHQQQPQIPIVRSDYQSDANGNYNFG